MPTERLIVFLLWSFVEFMYCFVCLHTLSPKINRLLWFFLLFSIDLIPIILAVTPSHYFSDTALRIGPIIIEIAPSVLTFLFLKFTCKDKAWRILLIMVLLMAIGLLIEILTATAYSFLVGGAIQLEATGLPPIPVITLSICIAIPLYFLLIVVWRRVLNKVHTNIPSIFVFLLIPLSQILVYFDYLSLIVAGHSESISATLAIGTVVAFVANLGLMHIIFTVAEKAELERHLREVEHIHDLERLNFESLQKQRHEMAKLHHDFSNQLASAYRLIENNDGEAARRMLDSLGGKFRESSAQVFCENSVVNAILSEKQQSCLDLGITLTADVKAADYSGIEPIHLCSIFSNLLDNAIAACRDTDEKTIAISSSQNGNCLQIKCVNPYVGTGGAGVALAGSAVAENALAEKERKPRPSSRGYGTYILTEIAEEYGGSYIAEKNDGRHVGLVSLVL